MTDNENILLKLNSIEHEVKSLKHRVDAVEKKQDSINSLTNSVNELAINMKYMLEEQKKQGARLNALEKAPADDAKYYRRTLVAAIITTIVGVVIGSLLTLLLK